MGLTELLGLEDFGLRSRRDLAVLGRKKVTVEIHWTTPPMKALLHRSPRERKRLVSDAYWNGINTLRGMVPGARFANGKLTIAAESLANLPRLENIGPLSLSSVQGIARRKARRPDPPQHFAVIVRLVEQIAGKRRGMQSINDRTVILMAKNAAEAKRRVARHFRRAEYATPYVLPSGDPVRWRLEGILKVCRVVENPLEDGITTVWNATSTRRMKADSGWRP